MSAAPLDPETPREPSDVRDTLSLTEAAARGDRAAVDALLERHLPDLQAFIRLRAGKLLRGRESRADLVQSVCREVLEHMDTFKHPSEGAFKHWLFTTALRKLSNRRDYLLAGKRDVLAEVPLESAGDSGADLPPGQAGGAGVLGDASLLSRYRRFSSPSQRAELADEVGRIETAFEQLSDEHREVITLAHIVGLTRAEIAERMGKSEGAVRVLLHRALARISELLPNEPG